MSAPISQTTGTQVHDIGFWNGLEPDPNFTVSQWADNYRILSQKGAAEHGPWRTSRTPYLREIMDALSPQDRCERVVWMKSAQIGGTEAGNNWLGYFIHHSPGPALMVEPTDSMIKKLIRQRLDPMFEETPVLKERVATNKSRSGANNLEQKDFIGGTLILTGANSASALRSMPIRYLFADEVDAWPHDVEGEGDPLRLAEVRTNTYKQRRKIFVVSTPTVKGLSRIEREFLMGDQRRYFVPCPHCEHMQVLRWKDQDGTFRLVWDKDAEGKPIPESVNYLCEACGVLIEERFKTQMLERGQWQPTAPGDGRTKSYHISALYSPLGWYSWADMAREFVEAKDNAEKLKTWVNTSLGETWDPALDQISADQLNNRLEIWERGVIPEQVAVITAAADVQGDRIEAKMIGYGAGEEEWLIDYEIFWGDPNTDDSVWMRFDEWRLREMPHKGANRNIRASIVLVDSGSYSDSVYDYVMPRQNQRVYAIKGRDFISRPGLAMQGAAKNAKVQLWTIATRAAKDRIMARLKLTNPGPGYIHLPDWIPEQYVDQMASEKKVIVENRRTGGKREEYRQSGRNEALDLEVYCLAGLFILQNYTNPGLYRDLAALHSAVLTGVLPSAPVKTRGMRTPGLQKT